MDMETEIQMLAQSMTGADQGEQDYLAALCAAQWERISQMLPEETESGRSRLICAGGKPWLRRIISIPKAQRVLLRGAPAM